MRSTLFFLPHQIGPLPLFGFGWLLIALGVWIAITLLRSPKDNTKSNVISENLSIWLVAAALIVFVFPRMETVIDGESTEPRILGVPIRGYGVMLMLGTISGIGLTLYRSRKLGFSTDRLMSLAVWSCVSGIIGARIFFVVQKWSELPGDSWFEKVVVAFQFTEGGLVVYGGMIGGLVAASVWSMLRGYRLLTIADLIAPGFMLGMAFGRVGCFLHGCCFGGVCQNPNLPSVHFPSGSEPYMAELSNGELLGIQWEPTDDRSDIESRLITSVESGSWADRKGLRAGQRVDKVQLKLYWPTSDRDPAGPQDADIAMVVDGKLLNGPAVPLPNESLPLHPAQIYASVNAFLISLVLFFYWPVPKRSGIVFAQGLILYGIARIIEEIVRVDEKGQFGTNLTISQWISICGIVFAVGLMIYQSRRLQ